MAIERELIRVALERFRQESGVGEPPVVYGEDEVDRALACGAVETVLLSGGLAVETIYDYERRTGEEGGEYVVVPPDTEDGARFEETFDVAAILRVQVD